MKQQVIVIHGGNTFKTRRGYLAYLKKFKINYRRLIRGMWREKLTETLGRRFEVAALKMPNQANARYEEWEMIFQKLIPFLKGGPIFVGHSLGGIFLAKYLSEHKFPRKIRATFLVAAPYDNDQNRKINQSLGSFVRSKNLTRFQKQGGDIFLYHSEDDPIVPFSHLEKYQRALPHAKVRIFKNRGHFGQATFPELVSAIKKLAR